MAKIETREKAANEVKSPRKKNTIRNYPFKRLEKKTTMRTTGN